METTMIGMNLVGKKCGPIPYEYTWKDVVLYALSIGAQTDELSFIYENAKGGLKVIPSFCVVMCHDLFVALFKGVKIDASRFIHGEEAMKLYRPIPPEGKVITEGEITNIYDKGKGALIIWTMRILTVAGEILAEAEHTIFYVGAGGFGGDPGPKTEALNPPQGMQPDFAASYFVQENQAALYRLNGDTNPLHVDPEFAKMGGFPLPILHGLCTYGYAVRAVLHKACGGNVEKFKEFRARFSGVVYPGDTLITQGWTVESGHFLIQARTDRGVVLSNAYAYVG
jgi:acyl dehydratase